MGSSFLHQKTFSLFCKFAPASYVNEPDNAEHIAQRAWFKGMDGQLPEREVIMGRPALRRDIPGMHSIELSYPAVLVGQVSLMHRLVRWQKQFMKERGSSFTMTNEQSWEYSLVEDCGWYG